MLDCVWNVMAHAQKPDFVLWRNGRIHLNRRGRQFSQLLAAEVCASAVVMLHTPCSEVVWRVLATHSTPEFPLHYPPFRHRVPPHFNWSVPLFNLPELRIEPQYLNRAVFRLDPIPTVLFSPLKNTAVMFMSWLIGKTKAVCRTGLLKLSSLTIFCTTDLLVVSFIPAGCFNFV